MPQLLDERMTELRVMLARHSPRSQKNGLVNLTDTHITVNVVNRSLAQQKAALENA